MPRPALTRSRIVAAGVALSREIGLSALTPRSVARRVNATATGVGRQIGATEMLFAVVDEILASMPSVPPGEDWLHRLRSWGHETHAWLIEYPGLARHLLQNRWNLPAVLDRLEEAAMLVERAGVAAEQSVMAASALYWFVLGRADLDETARLHGTAFAPETIIAESDGWPTLRAQLDRSAAATAAQFAFAMDLLMQGMAELVLGMAGELGNEGGAAAATQVALQ
jgi:Tetracyclin repressor-like, C-terminal domain